MYKRQTVESAQIRPNREVPTGEVVFETTSGDREEFNVLDVKEVEMALRKAGVPYTTTSVRQDSYFMTVILPKMCIRDSCRNSGTGSATGDDSDK